MVDDCDTLIDMVTRDTFDYVSDVVGLLNELNDENEQLKHDATVLIYSNQDYRKENEQLKKQNDFLTTQLAELSTYMMALGYDIELEFEDGRVIKLNEELKGDVE